MSESFRYDPELPATHTHSRASAIARGEAWISEQRRSLRLDNAKVGERLSDVRLGDWMLRYRREAEEGDEVGQRSKASGVRTHAQNKGAKKEANVLLGWEARFPDLCALPPAEVTPQHVREAMNVLGSKYKLKPATIGRWVAVLSAVFVTAAEEWQFPIVNPVHRLPRPTANNHRDRLVSDDEFRQVLEAIPDASTTTRAVVVFLRWTGCRRSEAINLDWKDVDWSRPIVEATFRDTKDPRGRPRHRTIPLASEAEAVLRGLFKGVAPKRGKIFAIHPDAVTTAWERGCARAGVKDARIHDLRHTRLTEVTALLPMLDAQRISGHLDLRMLQRYYHPKAQEIGKRLLEAQAKHRPMADRGGLTAAQAATLATVETILRSQGIDPVVLRG